MKVIITFTFCCDNLRKSKFMALEKPGKLKEFFSYFVATLFKVSHLYSGSWCSSGGGGGGGGCSSSSIPCAL